MAIVARFSVSNMTAEKYDAALKRMEVAGLSAPAGRLYHVSFGARESLQVIDVFDSPQALENFGKALAPILQEMGVTAAPQVDEVYRIIKG